VVFVSHNEYFISKIATRVIEMRPGVVRDFPGTISQYRSFLEAGYMKNDDAAGGPKKQVDEAKPPNRIASANARSAASSSEKSKNWKRTSTALKGK